MEDPLVQPCPSEDRLAAYVAGALRGATLQSLDRHLDGCLECSSVVAILHRSSSANVDRAAVHVGDRLGRYEVEARVGAGGMGVVYRGYDPRLRRIVALKAVRIGGRAPLRKAQTQRLRREAAAMAQLNHPNVVRVFDVDDVEDGFFIAMEFIDGHDLQHEMLQGPMPWRRALALLLPAGEGLAAAHDAGLVHRDFKPSNVLIADSGRVCVADFGLARGPGQSHPSHGGGHPSDSTVTEPGMVAGTPAYMPPEAASGTIDPLGDQFSFCATCVHVITGRLLARDPKATEVVPVEIRRILLRGLSASPQARWPSMRALIEALNAAAAPRRRLPWVAAAAGFAAVSALVFREPEPCADQLGLADVWNDTRGEVLRNSHADGPATAAVIDQAVRPWQAAAAELCTRPSDPGRRACLESRFGPLRALLAQIPNLDVAQRSKLRDSLLELPGPEACDAPRPVSALDGPPRVVRQIEEAHALFRLAQYADALKLLEALRGQVELEWTGHWAAQADLLAGRCLARLDREQDAFGFYEAAYSEALRIGDPKTAAVAALKRSRTRQQGLDDLRESEFWARNAGVAIASGVADPSLQLQHHVILSELALRRGRREEALYQLALAMELRSSEIAEVDLLEVIGKHALLQAELDPTEASVSRAEAAVAAYREAIGEEHPDALAALAVVASMYEALGRPDHALGMYKAIAPALEVANGPQALDVQVTWARLGGSYLQQHPPRVDQGRAAFLHALDLLDAGEDNSVSRAYLLIGLSDAERMADNVEDAIDLAARALVLGESSVGQHNPLIARALLARAEAELKQDNASTAAALLTRALASRDAAAPALHDALSRAHLDLGDNEAALASASLAVQAWSNPLRRAYSQVSAAKALAALGRVDEARAMAQSALAALEGLDSARAQSIRNLLTWLE